MTPTSGRRLQGQGPDDLGRLYAQPQFAQRHSVPPPQPTHSTEARSATYPSVYPSGYSYLSGTSYGPRTEPRDTEVDHRDSRSDPGDLRLDPRDSRMDPRDPRLDTHPDPINTPGYPSYVTSAGYSPRNVAVDIDPRAADRATETQFENVQTLVDQARRDASASDDDAVRQHSFMPICYFHYVSPGSLFQNCPRRHEPDPSNFIPHRSSKHEISRADLHRKCYRLRTIHLATALSLLHLFVAKTIQLLAHTVATTPTLPNGSLIVPMHRIRLVKL